MNAFARGLAQRMVTKQYFSLYRPWDMSFVQKYLFRPTGSRRSKNIHQKNYICCLLKPVFFLPFLSFLSLQLEPPKLRALKVQAPQVQVHQQVWALALAWLVPLRALSPRHCPWCPCYISSPFSGVSLEVLVVLHGVAGTQRLKISATRTLEQAFIVDCFHDIALFLPLLLPAAS